MNKQLFPIGLVVFVLVLAVYKAYMLASGMQAGWLTVLLLTGLDQLFVLLFLLLAVAHGFSSSRPLRLVIRIALSILAAIFLIDSFVLLALDDHAVLFDIGRYSVEWGVVVGFIDGRALAAIFLLLLSVFLSCVYSRKIKTLSYALILVAVLGAVLSNRVATRPLASYAMISTADLLAGIGPEPQLVAYSNQQIDFYAALTPKPVTVPRSKPDIVLVVVESLSSINSMKVSGSGDTLARFDELAEEGTLFRNFFANHQASEGGLIALLGGYPPIHFPTATPYMFDEFADQPSVLATYRDQGYVTEFLTNADIAFIGLDHFLKGLGVDQSRGRDEIATMRNAPRVVQDAPADDLLYEQALLSISQLAAGQQPFLMVLATTSTHLPYTHPEAGPDTAEAVWDWSLQQLAHFYRALKQQGFFEHGILLITGDHRQMQALTAVETARYGDSARARVPLLVIGKAFARGALDERLFQQSDLLRMLGNLDQADSRLSPQTVWVERYNRKYGRVDSIDQLSVFDERDLGREEHRLKLVGNRIEWLQRRPDFARSMETRIHSQRSLHQQRRTGPATQCQPEWPDRLERPSDQQGLQFGVFNHTGLDGLLDIEILPKAQKQILDAPGNIDIASLPVDSTLLYSGFIHVQTEGDYRFRVGAGQVACVSVDKTRLLSQSGKRAGADEVSIWLTAGYHFIDLRFLTASLQSVPVLEWITPGMRQWWWKPVPAERFFQGEGG